MKASIIIPTRNRAAQLQQTVESIRQQKQLNDVEVIVIDNGSDDDTADIVSTFAGKIPILLMIILISRACLQEGIVE